MFSTTCTIVVLKLYSIKTNAFDLSCFKDRQNVNWAFYVVRNVLFFPIRSVKNKKVVTRCNKAFSVVYYSKHPSNFQNPSTSKNFQIFKPLFLIVFMSFSSLLIRCQTRKVSFEAVACELNLKVENGLEQRIKGYNILHLDTNIHFFSNFTFYSIFKRFEDWLINFCTTNKMSIKII